jgi:nicotinamide-nucleotide amidase
MATRKIKKKVEFIAIGSELLTSHFLETNSLYLAGKLEELGLQLSYKTVVGDRLSELQEALEVARARSWLIIMSGGLGPTEDDRTKEALSRVLHRRLVFRKDLLEKIKKRFESRGLKMPLSNRKQALVIEGAEILENPNGTAPGLWVEAEEQIFILLPGPPRELKPMVENLVLPKLKNFSQKRLLQAVLRVTGCGESWVEDHLKPVYSELPKNLELITLASPGEVQVRLRLLTEEKRLVQDLRVLNRLKNKILTVLGNRVFSQEDEPLEKVIGSKLAQMKKTLACAESCSGGLLASRITDVPGSSSYFLESVVTYSNESKIRLLGVQEGLINEKGAVSAEVAEAMARGVRERAGADFGLSTTGIAGPGGGSEAKPVGLVYTGLAFPGGVLVEKNFFLGNREQIKFLTTQKALDMLRLKLVELEKKTKR